MAAQGLVEACALMTLEGLGFSKRNARLSALHDLDSALQRTGRWTREDCAGLEAKSAGRVVDLHAMLRQGGKARAGPSLVPAKVDAAIERWRAHAGAGAALPLREHLVAFMTGLQPAAPLLLSADCSTDHLAEQPQPAAPMVHRVEAALHAPAGRSLSVLPAPLPVAAVAVPATEATRRGRPVKTAAQAERRVLQLEDALTELQAINEQLLQELESARQRDSFLKRLPPVREWSTLMQQKLVRWRQEKHTSAEEFYLNFALAADFFGYESDLTTVPSQRSLARYTLYCSLAPSPQSLTSCDCTDSKAPCTPWTRRER
jgi:hypothetical protein